MRSWIFNNVSTNSNKVFAESSKSEVSIVDLQRTAIYLCHSRPGALYGPSPVSVPAGRGVTVSDADTDLLLKLE